MTEPMPMPEADSASAREWYDTMAQAPEGSGVAGSESVSGGDGGSLAELFAQEPSDSVPVATGTYSLYHATDGSVVLVLDDSKVGVKTMAIPRAMVAMVTGRRTWRSLPLSIFSKGMSRG